MDIDTQAMQGMIDGGTAWHFEGSIGRAAMAAIESGQCMLGHVGAFGYWGYIPSRWEVQAGSKGSPEYAGHHVDRVDPVCNIDVVNETGETFGMESVPVALVFGRIAADLERGAVQTVTIRDWQLLAG